MYCVIFLTENCTAHDKSLILGYWVYTRLDANLFFHWTTLLFRFINYIIAYILTTCQGDLLQLLQFHGASATVVAAGVSPAWSAAVAHDSRKKMLQFETIICTESKKWFFAFV